MFTISLPMHMCEHIAMGQPLTHNRNTFILINKNKTKLYKERLLKNNHLQTRWTAIKQNCKERKIFEKETFSLQ